MKITILGSGTSSGVPTIGCSCSVCTSKDSRNKRTRCSIWIESEKTSLLVDTSTEFRIQAIREGINHVDALLFTHDHADHIHGLDDIRPLTRENPMPVFGTAQTLEEIQNRFSYIFKETQKGGGKPRISMIPIDKDILQFKDIEITPLPVKHGQLDIRGYRFNNIAYITDCSYIPDKTMEKIMDLDLLILGALRYRRHSTHFSIDEALDIIKKTRPRRALLTHFSHDIDHAELSLSLPEGVEPCFDGMVWEG